MLGWNQIGMRELNGRVVLHAIRLHGSLPKAELAQLPCPYAQILHPGMNPSSSRAGAESSR